MVQYVHFRILEFPLKQGSGPAIPVKTRWSCHQATSLLRVTMGALKVQISLSTWEALPQGWSPGKWGWSSLSQGDKPSSNQKWMVFAAEVFFFRVYHWHSLTIQANDETLVFLKIEVYTPKTISVPIQHGWLGITHCGWKNSCTNW